jgi:hypothetical protein
MAQLTRNFKLPKKIALMSQEEIWIKQRTLPRRRTMLRFNKWEFSKLEIINLTLRALIENGYRVVEQNLGGRPDGHKPSSYPTWMRKTSLKSVGNNTYCLEKKSKCYGPLLFDPILTGGAEGQKFKFFMRKFHRSINNYQYRYKEV